jgi:hypothetical protein
MAAALSRVYAGLCRRDRLTSKECPFWLYLFCGIGIDFGIGIDQNSWYRYRPKFMVSVSVSPITSLGSNVSKIIWR